MYPERGTVVAQIYHNRDTFDFSQGHVTKNQPMEVFTETHEGVETCTSRSVLVNIHFYLIWKP